MDFWSQLGLVALAVALGVLVGAEREYQGKAAGMRTHGLIAMGAALFVTAGRWGFDLAVGTPGVDPARIAAQVVAGIGFLGAGVIFVHRNLVFGMTTAASIWMTTALAMASAAGLPWLAVAAAGLHLAIVAGLSPVERLISRHARHTGRLRLRYTSAAGVLSEALAVCTAEGFSVAEVTSELDRGADERVTTLTLEGRGSVAELTSLLSSRDGIVSVHYEDL